VPSTELFGGAQRAYRIVADVVLYIQIVYSVCAIHSDATIYSLCLAFGLSISETFSIYARHMHCTPAAHYPLIMAHSHALGRFAY